MIADEQPARCLGGESLFMAQRRAPFSLRVNPGISNLTKINNAVCRYDDN